MKKPKLPRFFAAAFSAFSLCASFSFAATTDPVEFRLEMDRTCLPAGSREIGVVKVSVDTSTYSRPENRSLIDLMLVIDRSGSMEGQKLTRAKEAALTAVRRLTPDDIFSLVAYDSTVETLIPAQKRGDGREIERAIRRIEANGSTALFGGVSQGAAEVRKHLEMEKYCPRIILVSDGIANIGPSSPEDLGRLGSARMKEGIPVTTVGLGLGYNEDLMTQLAQRSDGNTYFVESSDDLPRIFTAELGDALSVVARRVVVTVAFRDGVRPRKVLGRDGVISDQTVCLEWGQVYGGQKKFALIEVEVAPGKAGSSRNIANATVAYEDVLEHRGRSAAAERRVKFTDRKDEVRRSANLVVQADYARNLVAVAKDEAIELVDAHQNKAAAEHLRAEVERVRIMATTYNNAAAMNVAQTSAPVADRMESRGLGNAERKALRADNAQTKSQQRSSH